MCYPPRVGWGGHACQFLCMGHSIFYVGLSLATFLHICSKFSKAKHCTEMIIQTETILHKQRWLYVCVPNVNLLFLHVDQHKSVIWFTIWISVIYAYSYTCLSLLCPLCICRVSALVTLKCKLRRFRCDSTSSRVILLSALPQIQHVGFPLDFCVSHKAAFRWFTYWCTQSGRRTLYFLQTCTGVVLQKKNPEGDSILWVFVLNGTVETFPTANQKACCCTDPGSLLKGPSCNAQHFWAWVTLVWS